MSNYTYRRTTLPDGQHSSRPNTHPLNLLRPKQTQREEKTAFHREALIKQLTKDDDALELILVKRPQDLTNDEVRRVAERRLALPAGSDKDMLFQFEQAFFDDKYGTEPVEFDATGRLVQPEPKRPINREPVAPRTPDGADLERALNRLAEHVADVAETKGSRDALRYLQRGLNVLNHAIQLTDDMRRTARTSRASRNDPTFSNALPHPISPELKDDGQAGPKTRGALRAVLARLGPAKAEEALALGQFDDAVTAMAKGRPSEDLRAETNAAFGHLFRDTAETSIDGPTEEGESLQMAINDLGADALDRPAFTPIREDGVIGPKTNNAFHRVLTAVGPRRLTDALGRNLGFFLFDAR